MGGKGDNPYTAEHWYDHLAKEYSGLNFEELYGLNYVDYLSLRREAFIWHMSRSDPGVEYLKNAYRLTQTKPDRQAMRRHGVTKIPQEGG